MSKLRLDVFFLSAVVSFVATGQTIIFPILPEYLTRFGGGTLEFGVAASTYALFGLLFSPLIGKVADRIGKKRVLIYQIAIFGISNLLMIFVPNFTWFLFLRSIEGLVGTSTFPVAISLVSEITSESERAKNIAFVTAGISFGIIIGPTIGGVLLDSYGLFYPFILSGILGLLGSLFTMVAIHETPTHSHERKNVSSNFIDKLPKPLYAFGIILLMSFINSITWMMIEPGFIYYFYDTLGYSATLFGIFVSAYGVFIFLGELMLGGLSDKVGRKPVLIFGAVINAGFYLILGFAKDYNVLVLAAAIAGISGGLLGPALNALISEVSSPDNRTFVFGLVTSAGSLATIIGPFFGGWFLSLPATTLQDLIFISVAMVTITVFSPLLLNFHSVEEFTQNRSEDDSLFPVVYSD